MKKLSNILKGKTCAVVSNSGSLLEHEYGNLIDSHDVVLRANRCVVKGFETHVGSRTDIRLLNTHCSNYIFNNSYYKDLLMNGTLLGSTKFILLLKMSLILKILLMFQL